MIMIINNFNTNTLNNNDDDDDNGFIILLLFIHKNAVSILSMFLEF